jgi:DNA-binding YbaB/EbfC family protein
MASGGGGGGFPMPGGMGDFMRQAQKMQKDMARIQEDLKNRVVEGTAGGDVVKVMVNGSGDILAVKIDPSAVDPEDVAMLEDLIAAAANQAIKKSRDLMQQEMSKAAGGMKLPGLF